MTMSDDAVYRIQVYTNLTDPSDPFSGTPVYSAPVTYTQDLAGVQTVEVPEVVLMPGSSYAVSYTHLDVYKRQAWVITSCKEQPSFAAFSAACAAGRMES